MRDRPSPPTRTPPQPSRPTAERAGRAEGISAPAMNGVLRPWWRIETRLDGLFRDGLIDDAEIVAAGKFRADYFSAILAPPSSLARMGEGGASSGGDLHGALLSRLGAIRRCRTIRARLGVPAFDLLVRVIAEDMPWSAIGRRLGVSDKTARRKAAAAIALLAGLRGE